MFLPSRLSSLEARRLLSRARRQPQRRTRLGVELLEDRLAPAILTVNSTADTASASDPYLSLREAIAIVDSATLPTGLSSQITGQISGTLHANDSDTIMFDQTSVTAPIVLGGTQLELDLPSGTAMITIDGGAGITVNGNNASRVFQVDSGVQATLANLTITGGNAIGAALSGFGGAILNQGTLTLDKTTVENSRTTGSPLNNGGRGSGGGANGGSGIGGGFGGGIYTDGTLTLTDGTVLSGNTAQGGSGGDGGGGGPSRAEVLVLARAAGRAWGAAFISPAAPSWSRAARSNPISPPGEMAAI